MKRFYHPLNLYDLERLAEERLATDYWHVVAGGVGDEITVRRNREAFDAIAIRPRLLTDVTTRDLSTTVLGHRISFPVMVPPAGTQVWAHPDGDVATARACLRLRDGDVAARRRRQDGRRGPQERPPARSGTASSTTRTRSPST